MLKIHNWAAQGNRQFFGEVAIFSSENFDSMKNYGPSEFPTQKRKIHFLFKNECSVRLSFCSGTTDISDLITVHDLDGFGVFPKLAHAPLIGDLGFHYILKILEVIE